MNGVADLTIGIRSGRSFVSHIYQEAPCRILFPRAEADEPLHAVIANVAGGWVGGDRLAQTVRVLPGARGLVTTPAAEKIYRTAGPEVAIDTRLDVADATWLEWMPQPTILFDGARLRRRTTVDLSGACTLLAGEVLVLGRQASGERLLRGHLWDRWDVSRAGRLIWSDRTGVDDWDAVRDLSAGYAGAGAAAIFVFAAKDAPQKLTAARTLLRHAATQAAATVVSDLLVVRWLGANAASLIQDYAKFWMVFRSVAGPAAARIPKVWQI